MLSPPSVAFQIDVGHLAVVADVLPEHAALIMADVNAVNVGTGVLALHVITLGI